MDDGTNNPELDAVGSTGCHANDVDDEEERTYSKDFAGALFQYDIQILLYLNFSLNHFFYHDT